MSILKFTDQIYFLEKVKLLKMELGQNCNNKNSFFRNMANLQKIDKGKK